MPTQILPRFIETQDGKFVNVAHVASFDARPCYLSEDRGCFQVAACMAWTASEFDSATTTLGIYDNEEDAQLALHRLMLVLVASQPQIANLLDRNFRAQWAACEAEEAEAGE